MKTSLIITTYNWKEALDLVLRSVARQTVMPDEVIVADDGSRADTGALVQDWQARMPVPVIHSWQEDIGFRLARSRNLAIVKASGDYLMMIDGDMVLHREFVRDQKNAARRGFFVQGARVITSAAVAERMLANQQLDLGFFSPGVKRRRHLVRNRLLSWLTFQQVRRDQLSIRGCNQAFWRDDLIRINGFDENMQGYGKEDNELVARLYNNGIYRRQLKFAGLAIHLYHPQRQYPLGNPNDLILQRTIGQQLRRCEFGLDQHLSAGTG